ncbi:hypothetical protein [Desulfogranum japonicum]|uniref:hypothetical protein n=1 Tax=Desulfogranum japonicum TaxID=231447 RepID=UPI000491E8E5|nr:hypothetical protein [Desulfogranum japonicum]
MKNFFINAMTTQSFRMQQGGLALLEVLLAVAVISITWVTLIGSQSQCVSLITEAQFETTAAFLMQQKLAELHLMKFDDLNSDNGEFGEDFANYQWKTEVQVLSEGDLNMEGADDMVKSILLTVFSSSDQKVSSQVHTLVCRAIDGNNNEQ